MTAKFLRIFCTAFVLLFSLVLRVKAEEEQVVLEIPIEDINIVGNTVFSDRELKEFLQSLGNNNSISPQNLIEIIPKLTEYYIEKGFISSGAFLPPQELKEDNKVEIIIIEGTLSEIKFLDNNINEKFLRKRLPELNKPLNINSIINSLNMLNNTPLIKKIKGEIVEDIPGKSILLIDIKKNPESSLSLEFSDQFSPSIGEFGVSSNFSQINILDVQDQLIFEYLQTEGLGRFKGSYSFPFTKQDTRLLLEYTTASSEIITDSLDELDIEADFEGFIFFVEQPLNFGEKTSINLGFGFQHIDSETFVLEDFSFSFIEGLENGETSTSTLYFTQELSQKYINSFLFFRSNFVVGVDVFDATRSTNTVDGIFWKWRGDFQFLLALSNSQFLSSRLSLQLSPDALLPIEKLTIGGKETVRGYRRNLISTDNGVVGSVDLQIPLFETRNKGNLSILPFVDFGTFWNNSGDLQSNVLASTGLALKYNINSAIEAEIDFGIPLIDPQGFGSNSTTDNFVFSLTLFPLKF